MQLYEPPMPSFNPTSVGFYLPTNKHRGPAHHLPSPQTIRVDLRHTWFPRMTERLHQEQKVPVPAVKLES